jgi:hypothetical protein
MDLTDGQRRHLTVFLAQVEDAVLALERLATDPPSGNSLRLDLLDLPLGFRAGSREDLAQVRAGLGTLAQTLQVEPLARSRAQEALGLVTFAIVQLEDAGSRGLRGYGAVDPRLPPVLDPALGQLRTLLARVAARLQGPGEVAAP